MKIVAKYLKRLYNDSHHSEITLLVENYAHQRYIQGLSVDTDYAITIKPVKSKRSLQQNKYMWALIRELALKTREDDLDLYIKLLDSTNAKFSYIWGKEETEQSLKSAFRIVKRVKPHKIKNSDGWLFKCYEGSSKFTIEEMNHLLDTLITWCINEGIETDERFYE
jgi:hypothetical protein